MSQLLRGLLGAVEGAGHGYFRGQQMKRDQAEEQERLRMAQERERIAQEDQEFQRQDRERQAGERASKVSNDFREHWNKTLGGAREGGMLRRLMANPDDEEAANDLLLRNPQRLTSFRTEQARRQPDPVRPPPSRTTDRGIEEFMDGAWTPTGRTPYRAPLRSGEGDGAAAAPRKSEQDEEIQGQAIMRQMKGQPPEIQQRFAESFSQAFTPNVSPGRIAFRVWSAMQDMSLPRGVTAGSASAAPAQADTYAVVYQRLLDEGMKPSEAAAQARRETGRP